MYFGTQEARSSFGRAVHPAQAAKDEAGKDFAEVPEVSDQGDDPRNDMFELEAKKAVQHEFDGMGVLKDH